MGQDDQSLEALLCAYQSGDARAFQSFFRRSERFVFNYLLARLRNRPEAEDAFQETYFRIHRYILKYDPTQPAMAWVATIARNAMIDLVKKRPKHAVLDFDVASDVPIAAEILEAGQLVAQALLALSSEERDLIQARIIDAESYESIARQAQISEPSARQKISRALKKLRSTKT